MCKMYYLCTEVVLLIDFMLQIYYLSVQLQQFAVGSFNRLCTSCGRKFKISM